jgi:chemotaxis protein methyltransferase CheR
MTISTDSKTDFVPVIDGTLQLTEKEFQLISDLVRERFGINLTEKKKALVRGRLNSLVKSKGFSSFGDYYKTVVNDTTGNSLLSLIDKISTNHSYFFREADHFKFLTDTVLPEILQRLGGQNSNSLRIWCAGCAAGEEAYTVAMVLADFFGSDLSKWDIGLLATDISVSALKRAIDGIYSVDKLKFVSPQYRKYFKKLGNGEYSVESSIKRMVLFKRLNLMRDEFPFKGKFHVIFCRNVMIYFDQKTKNDLVNRFHHYLQEDGYLFIGHSETLGREMEKLRYVQPTVYKKC